MKFPNQERERESERDSYDTRAEAAEEICKQVSTCQSALLQEDHRFGSFGAPGGSGKEGGGEL